MGEVATAADAKGRGRARQGPRMPREGTRLRALFDQLQANRGRWFVPDRPRRREDMGLEQLRNFYGLDVMTRPVRGGGWQHGAGWEWMLAGEWFGRVYVDYVAERLEEGDG